MPAAAVVITETNHDPAAAVSARLFCCDEHVTYYRGDRHLAEPAPAPLLAVPAQLRFMEAGCLLCKRLSLGHEIS